MIHCQGRKQVPKRAGDGVFARILLVKAVVRDFPNKVLLPLREIAIFVPSVHEPKENIGAIDGGGDGESSILLRGNR